MERKKIIPSFKELMADLKPMTFPEKLDHLWTYYKYHLLIVVLVGILATAAITGIVNANKEVLVSGMLVNVSMKQAGYNYLSEGYADKLGATRNQVVELSASNFQDLEKTEDLELNYNAAQVLIARVSGGLLDYAIVSEYAFQYYLFMDVCLDLKELFTQEELAQLAEADMLVYGNYEGQEERWPVALKIGSWPFIQDNVTTDGQIYFIVSGNKPDKQAVRDILEHIRAWES